MAAASRSLHGVAWQRVQTVIGESASAGMEEIMTLPKRIKEIIKGRHFLLAGFLQAGYPCVPRSGVPIRKALSGRNVGYIRNSVAEVFSARWQARSSQGSSVEHAARTLNFRSIPCAVRSPFCSSEFARSQTPLRVVLIQQVHRCRSIASARDASKDKEDCEVWTAPYGPRPETSRTRERAPVQYSSDTPLARISRHL